MFIKYEELDKLERDQLKGGGTASNEDVNNNNILGMKTMPVRNDVRFASENQIFPRGNLNSDLPGRNMPTLRPTASGAKAGKSGNAGLNMPKSNEKQADLM